MTKILIADDNTQNLYMLETVLKSHGHEVITAKNGIEAIKLALKNPPDIIVTDILMPGMDGYELCRRWKAHELLNHIPFVFYTATYTDIKDEKFGLSLGADRFVIKPQQPEVLAQIVKEILTKPSKARQVSRKKSPENETKVLEQYNEVLFRKLEKKVKELEDVIAKHKESEAELTESEEKFRKAFSTSPDSMAITRLTDGLCVAINKSFTRLMEYEEDEIVGKSILAMNIWSNPADRQRMIEVLKAEGAVENFEAIFLTKTGIQRHALMSAAIIELNGETHILNTTRDITERKQADEVILRSKLLLQSVLDSTPDWMYVKDFQHRFLLVNRSFAEAQNLVPKDMIGRADIDFFSEELCLGNPNKGIRGFHADDDQAFQGQTVHNPRNIVTWADGSMHIYDTYKIPLADQVGKIYAALVYSRDITEQREAEYEREASFNKLQKTLHDVINTMAKIVEMRDPYTSGHQGRVADLAGAIARDMKLNDSQVEHLKMAASIHDVGKMYIPSDILSKPGKLSDIEWAMIKTHVQGSYDILKDLEFSQPIALMVLQHHERLDGSGYPNGLKGEEMLIEAKILAVADVVEAMSSHRPYRPALGINRALEEITKNKGVLYDSDVVDICVKLFTEKGYKF